jgi:hypothetical protein
MCDIINVAISSMHKDEAAALLRVKVGPISSLIGERPRSVVPTNAGGQAAAPPEAIPVSSRTLFLLRR